jgi:hypothetical protein
VPPHRRRDSTEYVNEPATREREVQSGPDGPTRDQLAHRHRVGVVVVIKLLAEVKGTSPEVVLTRGVLLDCNVLPLIEEVAPALSDVLRVRVVRVNATPAESLP